MAKTNEQKTNTVLDGLKIAGNALKQPLIATLFGLVVGALVILACGENPFAVYVQMFDKSFFSQYYLFQTLTRATPIIICAMATAVAWRAGYINIGVEGQMVTGAFVGTVCALYIPGPAWLVMIVSIIIGMVAGALYALIPAVLDWKFSVSMVICTLMLNYVANYITSYFVTYPLKDPSGDGLALQTPQIDEGMRFWRLVDKQTLNFGFILAILVLIFVLFITRKTVFGYESKMGGFNPFFARYGGTRQVRVMMITMALSGALAALAGHTEVFGLKYRFIDSMFSSTSYAWTGLMAALIANLNPIGMFVCSIFLAGLQVGGQAIQRSSGIPLEIATIIQCCITLFVSVKLTVGFIKLRRPGKSAAAKAEAEGGAQA